MSNTAHTHVAIIGSGSAGYTAAIYAARANLKPILLQGEQPGGQLTITTDVENFPGFEDGILGPELMDVMGKQAERFGTEIRMDKVVKVDFDVQPRRLELESGDVITADTVIIATGASARLLGLEAEEELMGYGVSACATCDGFFFQDKPISIVGGGDSAMEEATFLAKFGSKVTIIHRRDEFRASKIMQERALNHPKIDVQWNKEVIDIIGTKEGGVTALKLKDTQTGEESTFETEGFFVAIGHIPNTQIFEGILDLKDNGYIRIKEGTETETNIEGVFAAGDVMDDKYRQAITAAGAGCKAALDAEHWLTNQGIID